MSSKMCIRDRYTSVTTVLWLRLPCKPTKHIMQMLFANTNAVMIEAKFSNKLTCSLTTGCFHVVYNDMRYSGLMT